MKQPFNQSITFKLDKAHFQECYEQSAPPIEPKNYIKAAINQFGTPDILVNNAGITKVNLSFKSGS